MSLRIRRGTDAQRTGVTFLEGELIYATDTKKLYVGDGTTAGGVAIDSTTGSINQLADVNIAGIQVGQILEWNGTQFVPGEDQGDKESITGADSTILVDATNSSINLDGTVKGHIIPDQNEVYNLGSSSNRFNDLFLSGSTINLGGATITATGSEINMALKSSGNVDTNDNNITNTAAGGHIVVAPTAGKEFKVDDTVGGTSFSVNTTLKSVDVDNGYGLKLATFGSAQYTAINGNEQAGQIVFDNPSKTLKLYNGTGWVSVGGVGGGNGVIEGQTYDININGDIVGDDSTLLLDTASKNLNVISGAFSGVVTAGTINANTINSDVYGSINGDAHITGVITAEDSSVFFNANTRDINIRNLDGQIVNVNRVNAPELRGDLQGSVFAEDSSTLVDAINETFAGNSITLNTFINTPEINSPTGEITTNAVGAQPARLIYNRDNAGALATTQSIGRVLIKKTDTNTSTETVVGTHSMSEETYNWLHAPGGTYNYDNYVTFHKTGKVAISMGQANISSEPAAHLEVGGNIKMTGGLIGGVQTISGPGAIDVTTLHTEITTTGADAYTLADGVLGQLKIISMMVDGGDATITPTTFANGATITFEDVNDCITLMFTTNGWLSIANQGSPVIA